MAMELPLHEKKYLKNEIYASSWRTKTDRRNAVILNKSQWHTLASMENVWEANGQLLEM